MSVALDAALLLARGRADAVARLAAAPDARDMALRSFWALAWCLPVFAALNMVDWSVPALLPFQLHGFGLDLLGYGIGWLGFAALSHAIAHRLGRGADWLRFIAVWNWCNLLGYLALAGTGTLMLFGLPDIVMETAWLVALGWALWLEWFAARLTLRLPGRTALALVLLDQALGLVVSGVIGSFR